MELNNKQTLNIVNSVIYRCNGILFYMDKDDVYQITWEVANSLPNGTSHRIITYRVMSYISQMYHFRAKKTKVYTEDLNYNVLLVFDPDYANDIYKKQLLRRFYKYIKRLNLQKRLVIRLSLRNKKDKEIGILLGKDKSTISRIKSKVVKGFRGYISLIGGLC